MINKEEFPLDISQSDFPSKSPLISMEEFLFQAEITQERYEELHEIGWIKAAQKTEKTLLFFPSTVYKVRKLERICKDFEIQALAAAIIVDLLDKVDALETEIRELKLKS